MNNYTLHNVYIHVPFNDGTNLKSSRIFNLPQTITYSHLSHKQRLSVKCDKTREINLWLIRKLDEQQDNNRKKKSSNRFISSE